jgi:RNA polymerase sigma-70 factor, ECF subfamily
MQIISKLNIQHLIEGCIEGDRNAQRKLYEYYYGKMMAICLRYSINRDDAVEILNSGFLKIFNKINTYKPNSGNFESWIKRIMINTAIDRYRKEIKKKRTIELEHAREVNSQSVAFDKMNVDDILKAVQKLTPVYRSVFNLFVIDGFSHKEIAEKLNISEGASKSNLSKARRNLKNMLGDTFLYNVDQYAR